MQQTARPAQKRRRTRSALLALALLAAFYLAVAYAFLPVLWSRWDAGEPAASTYMLTVTPQGIPGDPINVGLVGGKEQVLRAFSAAKWDPADAITLRSSIEIGASVLLDRPYPDAPVSTLLFDGRHQDLAFEKPVGDSADRRHHVRLWLSPAAGEDMWLGSASFDRGVGISHDTGQITHHIGPDVDAERDAVMLDLARAGMLARQYQIPGRGPTNAGRNGGGDPYFTDGMVTVGVLVK